MILDLERFIASERQYWRELESMLDEIEIAPERRLSIEQATRLYYLFQRCSADLAKAATLSGEAKLQRYLESLVARAYGEIQESRGGRSRWSLRKWFFAEFPQTFRKHAGAFRVSLGVTLAGVLFGALALMLDPEAKPALMPFSGLLEDPGSRVAREEKAVSDRLAGHKGTFSAQLMTHNTQVSVFTMALGVTWGIGSALVLFYNGVTLGAVAADYIRAGYAPFLSGWLLPHGSIEIPAILIGGQAGFVLAGALIGDGRRRTRRARLRAVSRDVVTLVAGTGVMLIWAGIIESFLSQYHQPVIPYALKIVFGTIQLAALFLFLSRAGAHDVATDQHAHD